MPIPKIKDVSVIECQPAGVRLTVVKITTDQDGLYGYGCATFTQRADLVKPAVERYLKPFLMGKTDGPHRGHLAVLLRQLVLEERPGAEQRDQRRGSGALGHQGPPGGHAGLPACRAANAAKPPIAYGHADGARFPERGGISAKSYMAQGFRHVRVQIGVPGMAGYGSGSARRRATVKALHDKPVFEPAAYVRRALKMFEVCRKELGDEVELLHDVHERVSLRTRQCSSARTPEKFKCSSWKIRSRRRTSHTSARSASSAPHRSPWASSSTARTNGQPLIGERLIDYIRVPRLPDRRLHAGAEDRHHGRDLRREDGMARPGRRVADRTHGERDAGPGEL